MMFQTKDTYTSTPGIRADSSVSQSFTAEVSFFPCAKVGGSFCYSFT